MKTRQAKPNDAIAIASLMDGIEEHAFYKACGYAQDERRFLKIYANFMGDRLQVCLYSYHFMVSSHFSLV